MLGILVGSKEVGGDVKAREAEGRNVREERGGSWNKTQLL